MNLKYERIPKIKPVLRLAGSKYKKLDFISRLFEQSNKNIFFELFGGTGIISVNIKNRFQDKTIYLNDFDNLFPLNEQKVEENLTSYEGLGKYQTSIAKQYFDIRVRNGLWNKVEIYNQIMNKINITHDNYKNIIIPKDSFLYLDPPYFKRNWLYKNNIDHYKLCKYLNKLDNSITWLLSYGYDQEILEIYKDKYIYLDECKYCGLRTKNRIIKKELWISNKNIFI